MLVSSSVSFADENKNYRYGLSGNNLVFKTVDEAIQGGSFRLAVKDGKPGRISVELVDIVANASRSKSSAPLNSSPFTPYELVSFTKRYPAYQPSDEFQYFEISIKFKDGIELDRPVLGGLSISLTPDSESGEELAVASSIVATFAYIPDSGINLEEYAPALGLTTPIIDRKNSDFFPLNLLPNFPSVPNHGDLRLSYELENTGKIYLQTSTQIKVEQLSVFGQPEGEVFTQSNEAFLVPGQKSQLTVEIAPPDLANSQLGIGIYLFTTTATGEMGDQIETSTSNQQTLLIFPWKQALIALVFLILFRKRIYRGVNWALGYGRALRDFRYNRPPKQKPEQDSVFQPVRNLETVAAFSSAPQRLEPPSSSAPVRESNLALAAAPNLDTGATLDKELLFGLGKREPLDVKPEATPGVSSKKQWELPKQLNLRSVPRFELPKLTFPSISKFQWPTLRIPRLPRLEFRKVDFSKAVISLLGAFLKPQPRPAGPIATPATKEPKLEAPQTSRRPEAIRKASFESKPAPSVAPRSARQTFRATGSSEPSPTPDATSPSSAPRPLYPYWYQPPKKGSSS